MINIIWAPPYEQLESLIHELGLLDYAKKDKIITSSNLIKDSSSSLAEFHNKKLIRVCEMYYSPLFLIAEMVGSHNISSADTG